MKKVLFIQTAFIGDAIFASSAVETWHYHHPQDEIYLLVRKGNDALFKDHPFLKGLLIWEKQNGKYQSLLKVISEVKKLQLDLVINFHRFSSSGLITLLSGAKEKRIYSKNPLSFAIAKKYQHQIGVKGQQDYVHEIQRNASLLSLSDGSEVKPPKLYPSISDEEKASEFYSSNLITISPSSVWFTKAWPVSKWKELIGELSEYNVVLLGGPSDKEFNDNIGNDFDHVVNAAGKLSLLASAALMSKAQMNFVNDSAPLHLASAMNAPVTAIFCSTIPEFGFGPVNKNGRVAQIKEELSCRPCGLHGKKACPEGHFICGLNIEISDVIKEAEL